MAAKTIHPGLPSNKDHTAYMRAWRAKTGKNTKRTERDKLRRKQLRLQRKFTHRTNQPEEFSIFTSDNWTRWEF